MRQKITINGHETKTFDFGTKHKVSDQNGTSYSFFETKKDGGPTKAFEQWKKYELGRGVTVDAEIKKDKKKYNGKQYTQRTILYFYTDEHNVPYMQTGAKSHQDTKNPVQANFEPIMAILQNIEAMLKTLVPNPNKMPPLEPVEEKIPEVDLDGEISAADLPF